jgi:WD40 repeat protein
MAVNQIVFSCNVKTLASSSSGQTVRIWDITTRKCVNILKGHEDRVYAVAFSPVRHSATTLASASTDYTIRIWDSSTGKCLHALETDTALVCAIVFSHDGKMLASACGNKGNISEEGVDRTSVQL